MFSHASAAESFGGLWLNLVLGSYTKYSVYYCYFYCYVLMCLYTSFYLQLWCQWRKTHLYSPSWITPFLFNYLPLFEVCLLVFVFGCNWIFMHGCVVFAQCVTADCFCLVRMLACCVVFNESCSDCVKMCFCLMCLSELRAK